MLNISRFRHHCHTLEYAKKNPPNSQVSGVYTRGWTPTGRVFLGEFIFLSVRWKLQLLLPWKLNLQSNLDALSLLWLGQRCNTYMWLNPGSQQYSPSWCFSILAPRDESPWKYLNSKFNLVTSILQHWRWNWSWKCLNEVSHFQAP